MNEVLSVLILLEYAGKPLTIDFCQHFIAALEGVGFGHFSAVGGAIGSAEDVILAVAFDIFAELPAVLRPTTDDIASRRHICRSPRRTQ